MKVRARVGIRSGMWLFPNAGVFVVKMTVDQFNKLQGAFQNLEAIMRMIPSAEFLADKLVCEVS